MIFWWDRPGYPPLYVIHKNDFKIIWMEKYRILHVDAPGFLSSPGMAGHAASAQSLTPPWGKTKMPL